MYDKLFEKGGMYLDKKEVYEICKSVDNVIADRLTESIVVGTSYEKLEAHYGVLPISKNCFYIRKRQAQRIICQRLEQSEEKKGG